ncbi:nitrilase-related carbon-nitrogen hydrolase [Streptosporangium saharense]|uniref:nitrilase-related carbon-nitrogen hydrolase n=1 Tax=Streptosporangium saharense TaxID=1706840 RepID=UPI0033270329
MNSPSRGRPRGGLRSTALLTVLSAVLLGLGTGLAPLWWCAWIAALPVLVAATRTGPSLAFAAGTLAWLGAQTPMWGYYGGTLELPMPMVAGLILGTSALFGLAVAAFCALAVQGRPVTAALTFPTAWVAVEFVVSLTLPHGAWWSLAYSQAEDLPVLQLASLTGPWGLTFLLLGTQAALAVLPARLTPTSSGLRLAGAVAAVLALVLGHGLVRLTAPADGSGVRVALLATDDPNDPTPVNTPEGKKLLGRYLAELGRLRADVAVLPENTFVVEKPHLRLLSGPLGALAARRHMTILAGTTLIDGTRHTNTALAFPDDGSAPVRYDKRHLIPGLESEFDTGDRNVFMPGSRGRWAIAICKDLDFPALVRGYRQQGASAIFAPAWDFPGDEWIHSRIALVRGVENGMAVARAPRGGDLLASDSRGRVLALARTNPGFASVVFTLPEATGGTPYSMLGDWLGWADLLLLPALLVVGLRRPRRGRGPDDTGTGGERAARRLAAL